MLNSLVQSPNQNSYLSSTFIPFITRTESNFKPLIKVNRYYKRCYMRMINTGTNRSETQFPSQADFSRCKYEQPKIEVRFYRSNDSHCGSVYAIQLRRVFAHTGSIVQSDFFLVFFINRKKFFFLLKNIHRTDRA